MEKLMTQYDFSMVTVPDDGTYITLVQLADGKEFKFYLRGNYNTQALTSHMHSLTDSLCEQWFQGDLSVEELKARQKARKEAKRLEREELEAKAKIAAAEATRLKAEQKAADKARRAART